MSESTPSRVDCCTMPATSSRVKVLVASSLGSTRQSRSTLLASALRVQMIGRKTRDTKTSGGASISTARSGTEKERFFGTISPNTTCRKVTSTRAMTKASALITSAVSGVRPSGTSSRWWIAGSDTFKINSEQMVMPSWLVASIKVACSIAYSEVCAAVLPASARGSICDRRAEMTANSAPTKKAFKASSTTRAISPGAYSPIVGLPSRASPSQLVDDHVVLALTGLGLGRREAQPVDPVAVDPLDPERALVDLDLVAHLGDPVELVGDEAGDRSRTPRRPAP